MPPSRNRRSRSTRAATQRSTATSSSRRGRGGGRSAAARTSRLVEQNTRNARKWIQVSRPPAPHIKFAIPTWIPLDQLTPNEMVKYGLAQEPVVKETETTNASEASTTPTPVNITVAGHPQIAEVQTENQPAGDGLVNAPAFGTPNEQTQTNEPLVKRARTEEPVHNEAVETPFVEADTDLSEMNVRFDFSEPETQMFFAETQGGQTDANEQGGHNQGEPNEVPQQQQYGEGAAGIVAGEVTGQNDQFGGPEQQPQQVEETGAVEAGEGPPAEHHTAPVEQQHLEQTDVGTSQTNEQNEGTGETMEIETTI